MKLRDRAKLSRTGDGFVALGTRAPETVHRNDSCRDIPVSEAATTSHEKLHESVEQLDRLPSARVASCSSETRAGTPSVFAEVTPNLRSSRARSPGVGRAVDQGQSLKPDLRNAPPNVRCSARS